MKSSQSVCETHELAPLASAGISKDTPILCMHDLERALLQRFPLVDAEPWDKMGLLVGDPAQCVKRVAVALDATPTAVEACVSLGANALITHHPVFLDPPSIIGPLSGKVPSAGAAVYNAVSRGVALINVHTALDVSREGNSVLARMLNLEAAGTVLPLASDSRKGYGRICSVSKHEAPLRLASLAARCQVVFGREPRVWGDPDTSITNVVTATGSAGNVVDACFALQTDCLVCGELRYHTALDAVERGMSIIEVGHDVSELPLTAVLAAALVESGVAADCVEIVDQSTNWKIPDATRV